MVGRESALIRFLRPAYERALDLAHARRGIPWRINGADFRISPYHRTRFGQSYDPGVAEFLSKRIRPGDFCLDVGANVGVYVLQLARWSGPSGKVVAFEPNPTAREILRQHLAWNGLESRVVVESFAIGAEAGTATMFAYGADGMSRLGEANEKIAETATGIAVEMTTLSEYCRRHHLAPDWVVIDVEGFEIQALLGFAHYLSSATKAVGIVLEMHPNVWASVSTSLELAHETFEKLQLQAIPLSGQSDIWSEHGHVFCERIDEE